jgi:hypothetical protein
MSTIYNQELSDLNATIARRWAAQESVQEPVQEQKVTGSVKNPTISLGDLVHCWDANRVQRLLDLIREMPPEDQNAAQRSAQFALQTWKGVS